MKMQEYAYHWDHLEALDPDQLVGDLQLTTEQILEAFPKEAMEFIRREFIE